MLDYLFVAGGALCATLLIYGGWLCSHRLVDSLRDLLARRTKGAASEGAIREHKEA